MTTNRMGLTDAEKIDFLYGVAEEFAAVDGKVTVRGTELLSVLNSLLADRAELLAYRNAVPVAWTDAEELRDLARDGCGAMLSLDRKDCQHADPRRQILLFTAAKPLNDAERAELLAYREASQEPVAWIIHTPETGVTYAEINRQSVDNIRNGYGIKVEITPLYAAPPLQAVMVPEGWKLVPLELTNAMRDAWDSAPIQAVADGWIKCSERLPESSDAVLVCQEGGVIFCAEFDGGEFYPDEFPNVPKQGRDITHWMPLPATAKEGE